MATRNRRSKPAEAEAPTEAPVEEYDGIKEAAMAKAAAAKEAGEAEEPKLVRRVLALTDRQQAGLARLAGQGAEAGRKLEMIAQQVQQLQAMIPQLQRQGARFDDRLVGRMEQVLEDVLALDAEVVQAKITFDADANRVTITYLAPAEKPAAPAEPAAT